MIQQKIADMEVKIESARMLNYKAACLKDNKQVLTKYCHINILISIHQYIAIDCSIY